jgi:hypothetical protein
MPSFPTPASPSVPPVAQRNCLSWDCPKIAPPSSCQHRSPLPAHPCGSAFGMRLPRPTLVPSSWFSTTSTVCSFDAARVYCNALPTLGFTSFSNPPPQVTLRRWTLPEVPSLPFEAFPPSEAPPLVLLPPLREGGESGSRGTSPPCCHDVHRTSCPLALSFPLPSLSLRLPARARWFRFRRASRLSSADGSVA